MKPHKTIRTLVMALVTLVLFALMAFQTSSDSFPYSNYKPIMMKRADMEAAIGLQEPQPIVAPGKLWLYNNFIFIIEQYKGIHILNNTNPANTQNVGFIHIDGCTEVAVKSGVIYTNNAVDLIALKSTSAFDAIEVKSRNRDALPSIASPEPWNDWYYTNILPENTIIVRWEPKN